METAIATSIDGNGRRVACDPYRGAVEAVLECAANLACVGAEPLGMTNCLNFGNPEKPHVAWQLSEAVRGLGDACRALDVPVVGMVGELPDARRTGRIGFANEGDAVAFVVAAGSWAPSMAGSELSKLRGEELSDELPHVDLGEIKALHAAIRQAVRAGTLSSVHDVAEGGGAVALAESCIAGGIGARVSAPPSLEFAFGEGPGAFLVSAPREALRAFGDAAIIVGEVGGEDLVIGDESVPVVELARVHAEGLASLMS